MLTFTCTCFVKLILRGAWGGVGWGGMLTFTCIHRRRKTALYADGATAWSTAAKHLGVPCFQVSHQMRQYCKDIWDPNLGNLSRKAGTQCLDADWRSLKTFLPKQTKRKQRQQGQSSMNPRLTTRCYQWVWRRSLHNAKPNDLLKALSKHMKKSK